MCVSQHITQEKRREIKYTPPLQSSRAPSAVVVVVVVVDVESQIALGSKWYDVNCCVKELVAVVLMILIDVV